MKSRIQQSEKGDNQCKARSKKTTLGFTMVEVIVAIAILSTGIIAVFGAMRICSTAAHHTRMLTKSVLLAEALLVEVRLSENAVFETKEGREGSYWWKVRIVPTPAENLGAIHVQVRWQEQQREQQYELFSLVQMKSFMERKY